MSKGPGKLMRVISKTLAAHPDQRFTIEELANFSYPDALFIERAHLVAVNRVVRSLETAKKVQAGGFRWASSGSRSFKLISVDCNQ